MNRFHKTMITTSLIVLITVMCFSVSPAVQAPEPVMPPSPVLIQAPDYQPAPPAVYTPVVTVTETPPLAHFRPSTTVPRLQPVTAGNVTPVPSIPLTPLPSVVDTPLAQFAPTTTVPRLQPSTAGKVTPTPIRPVFYTPPYHRIIPPAHYKVSHVPVQVAQTPATRQVRVFVNNRPMQRAIPSQGHVYVSLEEFLTAGDFYWENQNGVLVVTTGRGPRSQLTVVPASYSFQNNGFNVHTFMLSGRPYVNARLFANQVNLTERFTAQANVYDFYAAGTTLPSRLVQDGTQPTETTAAAAVGPEVVEHTFKDDIKASLIQPKNNFFIDTAGVGAYPVRGQVNYRNIGKDALTNARAVFKIVDGTGRAVYTQNHNLGTMAPGAVSKTFDYHFMNPGMLIINENNFKYEINYTGPAN
jgi:hypothetical protein